MKKTAVVLMLIVVLVLQSVLPIAFAYADTLYEQGDKRGDSVPSSSHSLPYTGSWNSVSNYTNSNYYFTGCTKFKISVDTRMNYSGSTGRFRVYLVDLDSSTSVCVLDSKTAQFSYANSTTRSVNSSHRYYLKFTISDNTRSCWGSMSIAKG